MKGFLFPLCLMVLTICLCSTTAQAQPNASSFRSQASTSYLDLIYFGITGNDEGLGYTGSYGTLGAKKRLGEDMLGGNWFAEARANVSIESGKFFGSGGFERQLHLAPVNADVGIGIFYDVDGDEAQEFGHTFQQLGVNMFLKTDAFDLNGNVYMPVKQETFLYAPESGLGSGFTGNMILLQNGFDAALQGFDAEVKVPVPDFAMMSANVYLGGYYYRSDGDVIDSFGGFRTGLNFQSDYGLLFNFELNHDERFQTTVLGQIVFHLGGKGSYSRSGRDLEASNRRDHIVRVNQAPIVLTNPGTGSAWRIFHVDNTAAAGGDGTFERPFNTLAAANSPATAPDDIIFVRDGDGLTTGMNAGIVLQDRQLLLGDGVAHFIPTVEVGSFQLPTDTDGLIPTITNAAGAAIRLADDNTVRGFNIDSALTGIDSVAPPAAGNTATIIDQVNIDGGTTGISLGGESGSYTLTDVNIGATTTTGGTAFRVGDGSTATVSYASGTITNTAGLAVEIDGLSGGGTVTLTSTINDSGNGEGIRINDATGTAGAEIIRFGGPVNLGASTGDGITISATTANTVGDIVFTNATITDRQGTALSISDAGGGIFNTADVSFTGDISAAAGINPDGAVAVDVNNAGAGGGSLTFTTGSDISYSSLGVGDTGISIDSNNISYSALFQDVTIAATSASATNIRLSNIGDDAGVANDIDFTGTTNLSGVAAQGTGQGVQINGGATSTGTINFASLQIAGVNGDAVDINGGANTTNFTLGGAGITNSANRSVSIRDMTGGGVTFAGSTISDSGSGIEVVNNTAPTGGDLEISFNNQVDISSGIGTTGFAVDITGNAIGGGGVTDNVNVTFADLDINTVTQGGLRVDYTVANDDNLVTVTTGSINTDGSNANPSQGAAVDIDNALVMMTFNSIRSDESTGTGLSLNNVTTGSTFAVTGTTTILDPVTTGISIQNSEATSTFTFNGVNIDSATNGIFLNANDSTGTYAFSGGASSITNSSSNAILITNSDGRFDNFTITQPDGSANSSISVSATGANDISVQVTNTITNNDGGTGTANAIDLLADGAGSELNFTGTSNTHNIEDGTTEFVINTTANNTATINLDINGIAATADTNNASRTFDFNDDASGVHNIDTHANAGAITAANNSIGVDSAGVTGTLNFATGVVTTPN